MKIIIPDIKFKEKLYDFFKKVSEESVFLSFDETESPNIDECANMINTLNIDNNMFLLGVDTDKNIIGSITLRVAKNRKRLRHVATLGIVVAENYWGNGYGKTLMLETLERAKRDNIQKIVLDVTSSNSKAISFYESLGFELEGRIKNAIKIDGIYYDSLTMSKFL